MDGGGKEINAYRMSQLMGLASKILKMMSTDVWHISAEEMETVLELIQHGIQKSREEKDVSE